MLVESLYSGLDTKRYAFSHGSFRMSKAEACQRAEGYAYLGYPESMPLGLPDRERRKAAAEDGDLHEADVIRRLLEKEYEMWNYGRQDQMTVTLKDRFNNQWVGHPDLYIRIDGLVYGLDVKGFRQEIITKYTEASEEVLPGRYVITDQAMFAKRPWPVMGQMQMYLHSDQAKAQGVVGWIVLAKNKNDASLFEGVIVPDDEYQERLEKRWRYFWDLMSVKRLPERAFERESSECRVCSFKEICWDKPLDAVIERQTVVELKDEPSLRYAEYWAKYRPERLAAESVEKQAKAFFEQRALEVQAPEMLIALSDGKRLRVSLKKMHRGAYAVGESSYMQLTPKVEER